jgi:hypothetical protein
LKAQFQAQTAIEVAKINAEAKVKAAELQASQTPSALTPEQEMAADDEDDDNSVPGMLKQLIALQMRPKRALRGADGRVIGAIPAGDDELMMDPTTGKVIGLRQ